MSEGVGRVLEEELRQYIEELSEKEQRFKKEILEQELELEAQLKKEKLARAKQSRTSFLNSLFATLTIVVTSSAVITFYVQDQKEREINNVLERQISISSQDFKLAASKAEIQLSTLMSQISAQREAISSIDITDGKDTTKVLARDVASMNLRLSDIDTKLKTFEDSKLVQKMDSLEKSIEGSPEKILSVPLIRNDFKNYKSMTEKELLRLEKNIEKLEGRLNFFVTTTVTLSLGIFAAVAAPLVSSFSKRRKDNED